MQHNKRLVYGLVGLVALLLFWFQGIPALDSRRGLSILSTVDAMVKSSPDTRRILILQHMPGNKALYKASMRSHKIYARAWGYQYEAVPHKLAVSQQLHPSFNKQMVLRDALSRELKKKDGAQWILFADADTIVYDPSVPVHLLLPPTGLKPAPYLLGSQDDVSFNDGVLLIRVVDLMLDLVVDTIDAGKMAHDPKLTELEVFADALREEADYSAHFYEMPQQWLNAYSARDSGREWKPQLHVHLAAHLKAKRSFRPIVQASRSVYRMAATLARTQGDRGSGLAHLPEHGKTAAHARDWWSHAKGGVMDIRFQGEVQPKLEDHEEEEEEEGES